MLVAIGRLLGELAIRLRVHDNGASILAPINKHIELMEMVDIQNGYEIEFEDLQLYCSLIIPEKGECFLELNRLVAADVADLLEANQSTATAAVHFMEDPFSLREQRLSYLFPFQN